MSFHREYLRKAFPDYDPHACTTPWLLDYRLDAESKKLISWQLQSFHYFQAITACAEDAEPGLALKTPGIPFTLCASDERGPGVHVFVKPEHVAKVFEPGSFPFVLVSAALPFLPCTTLPPDATAQDRKARRCRGEELLPTLRSWLGLLKPGGVLASVILSEEYAREAGGSLFESNAAFAHVWSAKQFYTTLVEPLTELAEVVEYDNLGNHFAVNAVLRKR